VGLSAFCGSCEAPQPLAPGADHFVVLGVPRRLDLDGAELERRYHEASRRVHPDRHQTAGLREQELSLAASAALTAPIGRCASRSPADATGSSCTATPSASTTTGPPDLAALVFEVQEQLAELRSGGGDAGAVRAARGALTARLDALVAGLEARYRGWDDPDARRRWQI